MEKGRREGDWLGREAKEKNRRSKRVSKSTKSKKIK
jgi:hypothetical protein